MIHLEEHRDQQDRPGELIQMKCARCGGGLARVFLLPGSYAEDKCHHIIQRPDGKREKCGWVTKAWPTRTL
jgi:hypothetical protein